MILLPKQEQPETTDGNLREAVGQPAGLGIPLFRPYRHPRSSALAHPPRKHRPLFRDLHQVSTINKEVLRQRTNDYHRWVEAFAKKHHIPMQWAEKGVRKEDYVRPHLRRLERQNQFG